MPKHASMIICRTPVRISLFGGGTDYPDYYLRCNGAVLGVTIDKYIYISLNVLSDFFEHKIRLGYSKTEFVKHLEEIQHPSVKECLKHKNNHQNLDIHIFADLPARTGLGSSSSFTVGFLQALYALEGKIISKQALAEEACFIEQEKIKENVGSQDQFHAAYGGLNIIEFNESKISLKPVLITPEKLSLLEQSLMIFYTGQTRLSSEILEEQIQNTKNLSNDLYLKQMYEMVYEAEHILSSSPESQMIQELAKLLQETWQLKTKLSTKVSNSMIDQAFEKAFKAGALGGKLCGAGSGGFLAFLVPLDKKQDVKRALKPFLEVQFKFENQGSTIIYMRH